MDSLQQLLLVGAALVFTALVFGALSQRAGIPLLLVFLVFGMLAGEDGLGRIRFDDYETAFLVGNLALAVILLDGGLRTRFTTFRAALWPSLALSTAGVVLTVVLVGMATVWALGFDWRVGLLLGAIVGSTDAAAVFALLKTGGLRLSERVAQTLEIESGANDPMAVFLTVGLIATIVQPEEATAAKLALDLAQQFGIGTLVGVLAGELLSRALGSFRRSGTMGEGLWSLLLASGGVAAFALANLAGGSGFLAVYLAGLVVGNRRGGPGDDTLRAMDGLAWLAQCGMFLLLGLLVTPRNLADSFAPAMLLALFLMFVARPLMVALVLAPFRFRLHEIGFIAWVGLRGAVPIVLAVFPLMAGVAAAPLLFEFAFVVALTSLLLQGTTVAAAARVFRVTLPPRATPVARVVLDPLGPATGSFTQYRVHRDCPMRGARIASIDWPAGARLVSVVRGDALLTPAEAHLLQAGDLAGFVAEPAADVELSGWFGANAAEAWHRAFGDFEFAAATRFGEVAALYGRGAVRADLAALTLGEAVRMTLGRAVTEGDAAEVGGLKLCVSEMDGASIARVALRLPRNDGRAD